MTPTTTQHQPLLDEWHELGEAAQCRLLPNPEQREAADTFARFADRFRTADGFAFPIARNMALTMTDAAAKAAIRRDKQTAQALANLVSLTSGDKKIMPAVFTLLNLIAHLEKHAPAPTERI